MADFGLSRKIVTGKENEYLKIAKFIAKTICQTQNS